MPKTRHPDYGFWLLILITLLLVVFGLMSVSWNYTQGWTRTIWHVCQSGLQNLGEHLSSVWQLTVLVILLIVIVRGGWHIIQQIGRTRQFTRLILPHRNMPPTRLRELLETYYLSPDDVVYLDLAAPYAFCQGFWRPRVWLTAGMVDLFTDEELAAVLVHEAYHCRRYDPLRLLISQALKAAFFFFPLVSKLANYSNLQQEVAADQSAIEYLGSDLPLLSALQKLLTQRAKQPTLSNATLNLFSVTEARLRRLIYPAQTSPANWQGLLTTWAINLSVIVVLGSIGFLATQPIVDHEEQVGTCAVEEVTQPLLSQLSFDPVTLKVIFGGS